MVEFEESFSTECGHVDVGQICKNGAFLIIFAYWVVFVFQSPFANFHHMPILCCGIS